MVYVTKLKYVIRLIELGESIKAYESRKISFNRTRLNEVKREYNTLVGELPIEEKEGKFLSYEIEAY